MILLCSVGEVDVVVLVVIVKGEFGVEVGVFGVEVVFWIFGE